MYKNIGKIYIENGKQCDSESFEFEFSGDKILYEVIRVIDGHALFLDDHLKRLEESLSKSHVACDLSNFKSYVNTLIEVNNSINKNIKIDVAEDKFRIYYMESFYPDQEQYVTGVETITAKIERDNPTVKKLNMSYKEKINQLKGDKFEVVLVNDSNELTEGSRANLLFIKNQTIYSAPLNEILVGITYNNVIKMAKKMHLSICYETVSLENYMDMEACFLTGTSLGVLPIKSIDDVHYDSSNHELVLQLMKAYQTVVKGE